MNKRMTKKQCGDWGEKIATEYLRTQGYRIIDNNYRCFGGEVDIVAMEGEVWCFVEVKTRHFSAAYGQGYEAVNARKQQRLKAAMQDFVSRYELGDALLRFDIVSIAYNSITDFQILLLRNAFAANEEMN